MASAIKDAQSRIKEILLQDIENNGNFRSFYGTLLGAPLMKDIVKDALCSGKRLRPSIIGSMSHYTNHHFMLFIEYVHASSLIVDDLPCMDNDTVRRGAPSIHSKYGEHMAQLTAYNLMITAMKHFSDGFYLIKSLYCEEDNDLLYKLLNDEINTNLGYAGICGGQALDLLICTNKELQNISPREQQELLLRTTKMKTGCLFSLSFILGWVSGGRQVDAIEDLKEAGYCFGICYQIIDDLKDIEKDTKKNGGYNNICKYYTYNEIIQLFIDNIQYFSDIMTMYSCWNDTISELYQYFIASFKKYTILTK